VEKNPKLKVAILERGADVLQKVRISGGGRCNVTHACFEPNELVKISSWREKLRDLSINFLLVTPSEWFEKHGVELKLKTTDGCFPFLIPPKLLSNVFLTLLKTRNRSLDRTKRTVSIQKETVWKIETQNENYLVEKLILTGSNPKYGK
jgi:predicted flavoprotein YhiN